MFNDVSSTFEARKATFFGAKIAHSSHFSVQVKIINMSNILLLFYFQSIQKNIIEFIFFLLYF